MLRFFFVLFLGASLVIHAEDPVVGKWKFPGNERDLRPDGTFSTDSNRFGTWKCETVGEPRRYTLTLPGGKAVLKLELKFNETVLEGTNAAGKRITATRIGEPQRNPPAPPPAPIAFSTPSPLMFPPVDRPPSAPPVAVNIRPQPQAPMRTTPPPLPVNDLSGPVLSAITAGGVIYRDVRPQRLAVTMLVITHADGKEKTLALDSFTLESLQRIADLKPGLGAEREFRAALRRFFSRLTLRDGRTFTGVKVNSKNGDDLILDTDTGRQSCTIAQVAEGDLKPLLATRTAQVLAADREREKAVAAAKAVRGYREQIDGIPTGELAPAYTAFLRQIGDPWGRDVAQVADLQSHRPLGDWLGGLGAIPAEGPPAFTKLLSGMQEAIGAIYRADRERSAYLAGQRGDLAETINRQQSGQLRSYDLRGRQVGDGSGQVGEALFRSAVTEFGFALGRAFMGSADERAARERTSWLQAVVRQLGSIYPSSPMQPGLISVRVTRESLQITNTSATPLTHMTVGVEFIHFISAPQPCDLRAIYVGQLAPGATVHLRPEFERNLWYADWQKAEARPAVAGMWRGSEERWIWDSGGFFGARVAAYALEGHVVAMVPFPEAANAVAALEVRNASRALGHSGTKDGDWAIANIRRLLPAIPAGKSELANMQALLANPQPFAEQGRAWYEQLYADALIGTYRGRSHLEKTTSGMPLVKKIHADIATRNPDAPYTLEIIRIEPGPQVRAILYPSEHPEQRREFLGKAPELEKGGKHFFLKPAGGPPSAGADAAPLPAAASHLALELKGREISGHVESRIKGAPYHINLILQR